MAIDDDRETVSKESGVEHDETFTQAAAAVREDAGNMEAWDQLEEFAAASQAPDEVAALYRELLDGDVSADVATDLSQRAVQFHEEWYREDSPHLVDILVRVLDVDPTASEWAFQRLTVVYTVAERWSDLLALYDREIKAAVDAYRKASLLEEAAQTAKDFARAPDKAIDYMLELLPLRRSDKQLVSSLERLLEKQERWDDLVSVWREQLQVQKPKAARATRLRIARALFERLGRPGDAISELRDLLQDPEVESEGPLGMLEKVVADESVDAVARREALSLLRERYAAEDRTTQVIATLGAALELADVDEQITLHRDAAERLRSSGQADEAMGHLGAVLRLAPDDEAALEQLRALADETGNQQQLVSLLVEAADAGETVAARADLRLEAAERLVASSDATSAIAQLQVLVGAPDVEPELAQRATRSLVDQLGIAERREEQLDALDRLSALEVAPARRREVLGRAARLAAELGDESRAIEIWERRLGDDPLDGEALKEIIALHENAERWDAVVTSLRRRVESPVAAWQKRSDLMRIARIQAERLSLLADAIATWNEVASGYGEDPEVADALIDLYEATERYDEMTEVLERTSKKEDEHLAEMRARLGRALAEHLQAPARALESFRRALDSDPAQETARAGLAVLCNSDDEGIRSAAVEALAKSYESTGEWAPKLALLDSRLACAKTHERQAELLREASAIQLRDSEAPEAAVGSLVRAFALVPDDIELEEELLRLAGEADAWAVAADGLRGAAATAKPVRSAELSYRESGVRRTHLDDASGALDAALAALRAQPLREDYAEAVAELAMQTERWQDAEMILEAAADQPHAPPSHLNHLLAMQRGGESSGLGGTLVRIAEGDPNDLDALRESATLLLETDEAVDALGRLYTRAAGLWRRGAAATGEQTPRECALWAAEELLSRHDASESLAAGVSLATDVARLPLEEADVAAWQKKAATRAAQLGDRRTAIALFQEVARVLRDDAESIGALGDLLAEEGRNAELLSLRHEELRLTESPERRIVLRMEIARLVTEVEEHGGRMEALRANLDERPGHSESLEALERLLTARRGFTELADLLAAQAARLEGDLACGLWRRVAGLAEGPLADVERAVDAYKKVVEYDSGDVPALDALARIHRERGEHAAASRWLERRLMVAEGDEKAELAGALSRALISAGRAERACEVLEMAIEEHPGVELFDLLADQYRKAEDHEALASTLTRAAEHAGDQDRVLKLVREAAALYRDTLERPADAIPVLRKGIELAPDDRAIKLQLAEGLRESGELDEARELLQQVIDDFGRRRTAERAKVHYQLGVVARAQGDFDAALEQLDKATKMAKADPSMLEMYGRMAREAGQLDRAEKAYRTLLMTVRRQGPSKRLQVGSGEVLYELHAIASGRGNEDQAKELLESAFEAAAQNDAEALRFRDALIEREQPELALRGLERRVQSSDSKPSKAKVLCAMSEVLDGMERHDEAFARGLEALRNDPGKGEVQLVAVGAARKADEIATLVDTLKSLIDEHKRGEDAEVQASLLVCLGEITEEDLGDPDEATSLFGRAEAQLDRPIVAWLALARVGAKREDRALQRRVLEKLVDAPELRKAQHADALHQFAGVLLRDSSALDEAVDIARRAFDADPRHAALIEGLDVATARAADHDAAMRLYRDVARDAGLEPLWLRFLERRAERSDATLAQVREAVDKARSLELDERIEPLLERAVKVAEASEEGIGAARWAMRDLAQVRANAGDMPAAVEWMKRATETAEHEDERRDLEVQLAGFAAEAGELETAAEVYERLLEVDLTDVAIWGPLLDVYARAGNEDRIHDLVAQLIDALLDPGLRNRARMVKARFMMEQEGRQFDAVDILKGVLDEEPDHTEAAERLATLYEQSGYDEDLVELLQRQLDVARDNQDLDTIGDLSLRLGGLLGKVEREDALDVYRRALDWVPKHRGVIESYLSLLGPSDDPRERAEIRERLLAIEEGDAATRLAHELYQEWQALEEPDGMLRALELGYRGNPHDAGIRGHLENHYRETQDWAKLADFLAFDARRFAEGETDAMVARLHEAAGIKRDQLSDPAGAVELLREAFLATGSVEILRELVEALQAAGDVEAASNEVSAALESHPHKDAIYAQLLAMRATLALGMGKPADAVRDLEEGYEIAKPAVEADLIVALVALRDACDDKSDERKATLRLVDVLVAAGDAGQARDVLAQWTERDPDDLDSLVRLRDIDLANQNWGGVVSTCTKLVAVQMGAQQVEAALMLADAAENAGDAAAAQEGLEAVFRQQPQEGILIERLRGLYETIGAHRELASLLAHEAGSADPERAFELYRRAGRILIDQVGDAGAALPMLQKAVDVQPDDHETTVLLADAYIGAEMFSEAGGLLEDAIGRQKRKRSPELSQLQHRMARLAEAAGDRDLQKQWLHAALDSDKNNGHVASELAHLSMQLGDMDLALVALRAVTLSKTDGPMSRAMAFLLQARIAHQKGEARRALLWARKAKTEDPELTEAAEFLRQLGEG